MSNNALAGKSVAITGVLAKYRRAEIEALVRKHGGRVANSVGRGTNYLVAGVRCGSKLARAKALKIQILTEYQFDDLIMGRPIGSEDPMGKLQALMEEMEALKQQLGVGGNGCPALPARPKSRKDVSE